MALASGTKFGPYEIQSALGAGMGADVVLNFTECDVVAEVLRLTVGKGVDVAIEALGTQTTFENALRVLRPGAHLAVWECTQESYLYRWSRLPQVLEITRSSRRFALGEKNRCGA